MIGSPWNPHFKQSLPSTFAKYDGSLIEGSFTPQQQANQTGGIDAHDQPTFLQIQSGSDFSSDPIAVMQRNYGLHSDVDLDAATWAAALPGIWGTDLFSDIFGSMFLWYYSQFSGFSGRMLWQSPADSDGYRWFFGTCWMHPSAYGSLTDNGYFNNPDLEYSGPLGEYGSFEGVGTTSTPDWLQLWTLFYTDRVPSADDGAGSDFDHPAFTEGDTYPVYINFRHIYVIPPPEGSQANSTTVVMASPQVPDAEIRYGMKAYSGLDITRRNDFQLLTAGDINRCTVSPWYG